MIKFISQHVFDIACIGIAVILTVIFGQVDTEMHEVCGKVATFFFYAVFNGNLMLLPWLAYHYYND